MTTTPTMIPAAKTTMAMAASVSAMGGPLTSSRRLGSAGPDLVVLAQGYRTRSGWGLDGESSDNPAARTLRSLQIMPS